MYRLIKYPRLALNTRYVGFRPLSLNTRLLNSHKNEIHKNLKPVAETIPTEPKGEPQNLGNKIQSKMIDEIPTPPEQPENQVNDEGGEYLTTIFEKMEPYMDTYDVFKQLTNAGFTAKQAEQVINLLVVQLNTKLTKLPTKYSLMFELENEKYLFESAQQELKIDITRSREAQINELIILINELERNYNIIRDELNNDILQLKNNNQVTINDEKQENTLMSKKIFLKIQETNHKITTELIGSMRSEIETLRWNLSRWGIISILICIFSGCATFYIYKKKTDARSNNPDEFIPLVIYEPSEFEEDDWHTDLDENVVN